MPKPHFPRTKVATFLPILLVLAPGLAHAQSESNRTPTPTVAVPYHCTGPTAPDCIVDEMLAIVRREPEAEPLFEDIARTLAQIGQVTEAADLAAEVKDPTSRELTFWSIAGSAVDVGDFDTGLALLQEGVVAEFRDEALIDISVRILKAGDNGRAMAVLELIEAPANMARAMMPMALTLAQNGQEAGARDLMEQSLALAQTSGVLDLVTPDQAELLVTLGDFEAAQQHAAGLSPDNWDRGLRQMARAYSQTGEFDQAVALLPQISDTYLRIDA